LFDPGYHNDSDVALLQRRRRGRAATNQNASAGPNIVIQNDFKGLAGLLQHNTAPPQSTPAFVQSLPCMTRAALVPKISLVDFCNKFDLSICILEKLDTLKITRPHALQFISNQHLVKHGGMDIGELADVRDAQEHWRYGLGHDENSHQGG
jgi:hypothetical protein